MKTYFIPPLFEFCTDLSNIGSNHIFVYYCSFLITNKKFISCHHQVQPPQINMLQNCLLTQFQRRSLSMLNSSQEGRRHVIYLRFYNGMIYLGGFFFGILFPYWYGKWSNIFIVFWWFNFVYYSLEIEEKKYMQRGITLTFYYFRVNQCAMHRYTIYTLTNHRQKCILFYWPPNDINISIRHHPHLRQSDKQNN